MDQSKCVFCGSEVEHGDRDYGDKHLFRCPICRPFEISGTAMGMLEARLEGETPFRPSVLSPVVRRLDRRESKPIFIDSNRIRQLLDHAAVPLHQEQANNMIRYLGDGLAANPASTINHPKRLWSAVVGAPEPGGGYYIARELRTRGLINADFHTEGLRAGLTFDGWDHYQKLVAVSPVTEVHQGKAKHPPKRDSMTDAPKVFISYSHDSAGHKAWVLSLASDLRLNGVDMTLDQWDVSPGDDLTKFMEQSVVASDRVIVVCTPNYVLKADSGQGGVGYEKMIVTGQLVSDLGTKKFIPIIRNSGGDKQAPTFLRSRLYVDFDDDASYKIRLEELLRELHNEPASRKPEIGSNPFRRAPS